MSIFTRSPLRALARTSQALPRQVIPHHNPGHLRIGAFLLSSTRPGKPLSTLLRPNTEVQDQRDRFLTENVLDTFSLKDRVIAVTGGAQGIGLALAVAATQAGAKVAILDAAERPHDDYQRLKEISPELRYYQ